MSSNRRLDTSTGAGGATAVARTRFDSHLNTCRDCIGSLCPQADALWRSVCLAAMNAHRKGGRS